MEKDEAPKRIRTVQRAIDILNCFQMEKLELTLTEIASRINLAKSTTSRLLTTLEANQFVEKNHVTSRYKLGKQLYFIGHIAGQSIGLRSAAESTMKDLRNQTNETVNLYIRDEVYRTCIQQFESTQSVKHMVRIGQKLPLVVGAAGKVLLAYQSHEFIEQVLQNQPIKRKKSEFENELKCIIEEKYVVSVDERDAGTSAAASPIFDIDGKVVAALSISGPTSRFHPKKLEELQHLLVTSANEISNNLGYSFS